MTYDEIQKYPICDLLKVLGQTIQEDIKNKHLHKQDICRMSGVSAMTLYRLCNGENVSLDALFRVLKAVGRYDSLELLLTPTQPTPMDLYYKYRKKTRKKKVKKEPEEKVDEEFTDDGTEWTL
jgi:transcriptional regulator with XRE-family HTH domain